ncbi:MAG: sarcosine oxidase subunit gamma [Alphaproteobacteria bacterium]|nr:sarcosine oxidase subunit gamma [Alphaproteobacteria bacterium]
MSAPEPRTILAGHLRPGHHGPAERTGATLRERRAALLELSARRGRAGDVAAFLREAAGLDLPPPGRAISGAEAAALWIAPATVLLVGAAAALEPVRARVPREIATALDQSFGYAILRLAGAAARAVLAKGCRVDLDPGAFAPGQVARTIVAQVPTILHQADAAPTFELIVPASLARSFADFLIEAAAEFGCAVEPAIGRDPG